MRALVKAEPVMTALMVNAAFWSGLFGFLGEIGYPVSDPTQHWILGIAATVSAVIVRSKVTPAP